jgi:hypothetical protein
MLVSGCGMHLMQQCTRHTRAANRAQMPHDHAARIVPKCWTVAFAASMQTAGSLFCHNAARQQSAAAACNALSKGKPKLQPPLRPHEIMSHAEAASPLPTSA